MTSEEVTAIAEMAASEKGLVWPETVNTCLETRDDGKRYWWVSSGRIITDWMQSEIDGEHSMDVQIDDETGEIVFDNFDTWI